MSHLVRYLGSLNNRQTPQNPHGSTQGEQRKRDRETRPGVTDLPPWQYIRSTHTYLAPSISRQEGNNKEMQRARQNFEADEAENLDPAAAEARLQKNKFGERARRSGRGRHSPGHGAIGLDAVLEAVELPAGVADLDPGLADVDADDLSHLARPLPPPSSLSSSSPSSRRTELLSFLGQGAPLSLLFPKCVRGGVKRGRRREKEALERLLFESQRGFVGVVHVSRPAGRCVWPPGRGSRSRAAGPCPLFHQHRVYVRTQAEESWELAWWAPRPCAKVSGQRLHLSWVRQRAAGSAAAATRPLGLFGHYAAQNLAPLPVPLQRKLASRAVPCAHGRRAAPVTRPCRLPCF
nr:unnamed protein product [Digitaria exilis]